MRSASTNSYHRRDRLPAIGARTGQAVLPARRQALREGHDDPDFQPDLRVVGSGLAGTRVRGGEITTTVRVADHSVRPAEAPAFVVVHQRLHLPDWAYARQAAVASFADDQTALQLEGRAFAPIVVLTSSGSPGASYVAMRVRQRRPRLCLGAGKSARFSAASWAKLGAFCAKALVMGEDCCAGGSNARFLVSADPEGWRIPA